MVKTLGAILTLGGAVVILYGIFGFTESLDSSTNSWAFLVLGAILYIAGFFVLRWARGEHHR